MTARQAFDLKEPQRGRGPVLIGRLLVAMERRRETSHPASHVPASKAADSANANNGLADTV